MEPAFDKLKSLAEEEPEDKGTFKSAISKYFRTYLISFLHKKKTILDLQSQNGEELKIGVKMGV